MWSEDTHRVVRVEDVGGRGVVHDDDLVQVATQAAQVLHVVAPVEDAGLPEQAAAESAPLVQEVGDGVCILKQTYSFVLSFTFDFQSFKMWKNATNV